MRRQPRDPVGDRSGLVLDLGARHAPLHQPEACRHRTLDSLAAENDPGCNTPPTYSGEALCTASSRNEPDTDLGQPDLRLVGGETQIARERELKAPAHRSASNLAERDLGELLDSLIKR